MSDVTYDLNEGVATITMDDGKANAMSPAFIAKVQAALDQAEADRAVVVLVGRPGVFSGGFDLGVFNEGPDALLAMLVDGAELAERILGFPMPVVAACTGHAPAMGAFLLLAADYRVGVEGTFKIGMNEVAIGMSLPGFAIELARQRLTPVAFNHAVLAIMYGPTEAKEAGFLDQVVGADELIDVCLTHAARFAKLDAGAHRAAKRSLRANSLSALRHTIETELTIESLGGLAR